MIQQSPTEERARLEQALSKKLGWSKCDEDDRIHVRRGDLRAILASQAAQPAEADGVAGQSDGDPDGWLAVKVNGEGGPVMPYGRLHSGPDRPNDSRYHWVPFYLGNAPTYSDRLAYEQRILAAQMQLVAAQRALTPFATKACGWEQNHPGYHGTNSTQISHRLGDFRAARTVLTAIDAYLAGDDA